PGGHGTAAPPGRTSSRRPRRGGTGMIHTWRKRWPSGLGGPSVQVGPRRLDIDGACCQTLIVTGYPRDVAAGWAQPLLSHPGLVDAALHIDPVPAPVAAERLRRRRVRLESAWR